MAADAIVAAGAEEAFPRPIAEASQQPQATLQLELGCEAYIQERFAALEERLRGEVAEAATRAALAAVEGERLAQAVAVEGGLRGELDALAGLVTACNEQGRRWVAATEESLAELRRDLGEQLEVQASRMEDEFAELRRDLGQALQSSGNLPLATAAASTPVGAGRWAGGIAEQDPGQACEACPPPGGGLLEECRRRVAESVAASAAELIEANARAAGRCASDLGVKGWASWHEGGTSTADGSSETSASRSGFDGASSVSVGGSAALVATPIRGARGEVAAGMTVPRQQKCVAGAEQQQHQLLSQGLPERLQGLVAGLRRQIPEL